MFQVRFISLFPPQKVQFNPTEKNILMNGNTSSKTKIYVSNNVSILIEIQLMM